MSLLKLWYIAVKKQRIMVMVLLAVITITIVVMSLILNGVVLPTHVVGRFVNNEILARFLPTTHKPAIIRNAEDVSSTHSYVTNVRIINTNKSATTRVSNADDISSTPSHVTNLSIINTSNASRIETVGVTTPTVSTIGVITQTISTIGVITPTVSTIGVITQTISTTVSSNLNETNVSTTLKIDTIKEDTNNGCSSEFRNGHLMEINYLGGRTGNQMFGLLTLLATAKHYCYTPILANFENNLGNVIDLDYSQKAPGSRNGWKTFGIPKNGYFSGIERLETNVNWTLSGYFQSWKYFTHQEKYMRSVIKLKPEILNASTDFLKAHNLTRDINVFVHVRRGDFLSERNQGLGYTVVNKTYLVDAMQYFTEKYKGNRLNFIYLSDDITWCKNNIDGDNIFYSPFSSVSSGFYCDLALMSLCNHGIMSSGSFGWMGGWLTGGEVVYFNGFPRPGSWLFKDMNNVADYYPPQWKGMP